MAKGKPYEKLIEKIYREMNIDAEIKHDDHIIGVNSGTKRQIDLSIKYKFADMDMLVIVQGKDIGRPADIKVIDEFISVIDDVQANKGILISHNGFTKNAIAYAKRKRIQIYSAHDSVDWPLAFKLPVLRDEDIYTITIEPAIMNLGIGHDVFFNHEIIHFNHKPEVFSITKAIAIEIAGHELNRTDLHKISLDLTRYYDDPIFGADLQKHKVWINFSYEYLRTETRLNHVSPTDYRVLKSFSEEKLIPSFVKHPDPFPLINDHESWQKVTPDEVRKIKEEPHIMLKASKLSTVYKVKTLYHLG